jgi:phage terminase large subunit-like protein
VAGILDEARASRAVNFFERILKHTKGRFAGKPFLLIDWERGIIREVFGTVDLDGNRQYQTIYVEVPKKNGKSELAAGVALYLLLADNEPGAEVYSAAAAKDQAALVFNVAASMVEKSPILSAKLRVIRSTKKILKRDDPDSFYRAISADGDLQDGINPHGVIVDELHRWKVAKAVDLMDVLTRGTIARSQPLVFQITTAGLAEESPLCWRQHEYTRQVREGIFNDQHFYGRVWAADVEDDWTQPETWAKANPSMEANGGFLKLSAIEKEYEKAKNEPAEQAAFKRFHLNIWGQKENRWMDMAKWDACSTETRALIERPCYAGLDLSSNIDLTSMVLLFPADDGSFDVLPFFWIPKENMRNRELKDKVPYRQWVEQGLIEATEGDVIDIRAVRAKLKWAGEMFELREIAFDKWHALQLSLELTDDGFTCVPIAQNFGGLSEPTKKLMELTLNGQIRHGGHPVLRWNADCVTVKQDDKDNVRPVKPDRLKSGKRIDGMLALIMAVNRATLNMQASSNYLTRGLISL